KRPASDRSTRTGRADFAHAVRARSLRTTRVGLLAGARRQGQLGTRARHLPRYRYSMSRHVIVGAGPGGTATARLRVERGEQVRVVTRRGTGLEHPAIERVAADATDSARLSTLAAGAAALYNCANPLYHRWLTDWPPLASALLAAAERSGAVLASVSNLYGYGPVDAPVNAATPLAATHP